MNRIAVGMSGGVDSAVAAAQLIDKGFDVEGFFMKNWDDDSEFCSAEQDYIDALQVCQNLGIPLRSINFDKEFNVLFIDLVFCSIPRLLLQHIHEVTNKTAIKETLTE